MPSFLHRQHVIIQCAFYFTLHCYTHNNIASSVKSRLQGNSLVHSLSSGKFTSIYLPVLGVSAISIRWGTEMRDFFFSNLFRFAKTTWSIHSDINVAIKRADINQDTPIANGPSCLCNTKSFYKNWARRSAAFLVCNIRPSWQLTSCDVKFYRELSECPAVSFIGRHTLHGWRWQSKMQIRPSLVDSVYWKSVTSPCRLNDDDQSNNGGRFAGR